MEDSSRNMDVVVFEDEKSPSACVGYAESGEECGVGDCKDGRGAEEDGSSAGGSVLVKSKL